MMENFGDARRKSVSELELDRLAAVISLFSMLNIRQINLVVVVGSDAVCLCRC
jgi:hypothetical protein